MNLEPIIHSEVSQKEPIIYSEVSQKEKDKYILMHIKCIYMHHSQQKS